MKLTPNPALHSVNEKHEHIFPKADETIPLVVDLDGTLLRSDMLFESVFSFIKHSPSRLFLPLVWLLGGKARLKSQLAKSIAIDVTALPYEVQVLTFLKQEGASGRTLILATASHIDHAQAIANHLGIFDRIFATNVQLNLSARNKRDVLVSEYGERGFDYVGNSHDDLTVWAVARKAYLVNPEYGVKAEAERLGNVERVLHTPVQPMRDWAKQLRLHQWIKNALVFVPLLAAHRVGEINLLIAGCLAFLLFGLCASSVYLFNDLLDLEDDRRHPTKCMRPLASGAISIKAVLFVWPLLLMVAVIGSVLLLPIKFTFALACYYALTLAYSLVLKPIMTVDVIVLSMLYTVRIVAGAFAFDLQPTFWMLAFSMFLFLSLALIKRYAELRGNRTSGNGNWMRGRDYSLEDLGMISSLGAASGYLAVLVLALYIQDPQTMTQYQYPNIIWFACPLLLHWVTRIWMLTHRGLMHEDPVVFSLTDRSSLLTGALFALIFWFAT